MNTQTDDSEFNVQTSEFKVQGSEPTSATVFSLSSFEGEGRGEEAHIQVGASIDAHLLLNDIANLLTRFVVLPKWAAETLALWTLHTYAFQLRDITTYIGIESPEKRCGKTTLLSVLAEIVNRPIVAANISSSAFFRVIEEMRPTLLIDECDTFVQGNDELRGILNSGYKQKTAYVVRVSYEPRPGAECKVQNAELVSPTTPSPHQSNNPVASIEHPASSIENPPPSTINFPRSTSAHSASPPFTTHNSPSTLRRYSCWCPKILASIGHLPDTLADRCIILRMERKTSHEQCARLRDLDPQLIRNQCLRFVHDNAEPIAAARPEIPDALNDRAADIWEPLFVLADLAGGHWPQSARQAAVALAARAADSNPISSLLLDIALAFILNQGDKIFSRDLVQRLNARSADRPWFEARRGKQINELWLSQQLRPYGIRSRNICLGDAQAKGYVKSDFEETFHRYIPKTEAQAYLAELRQEAAQAKRVPVAPAPASPSSHESGDPTIQ